MTKQFCLTSLFIILICCQSSAQTTDVLRDKIQQIISKKKATVGVCILGNEGKSLVEINAESHYPLQSVFKFHIAIVVLSQIDKGKFSLDQKININKNQLLPNLYSPLREDYPNGASLSISKIIEYTVSQSDNVGCDVLLQLIGGPKVVEDYFKNNSIDALSIKLNEENQQSQWDLQFQNWTTPRAANETLVKLYYNDTKLLSEKSHSFIWKTMKGTQTGKKRIKGQLPHGTIVAHKTGTSGVNKEAVTAAVNDIGIVFLPNGQPFFISVFVSNSKENEKTNEKIIADIAKASWDYFVAKVK